MKNKIEPVKAWDLYFSDPILEYPDHTPKYTDHTTQYDDIYASVDDPVVFSEKKKTEQEDLLSSNAVVMALLLPELHIG
jgi:hypothetical protein